MEPEAKVTGWLRYLTELVSSFLAALLIVSSHEGMMNFSWSRALAVSFRNPQLKHNDHMRFGDNFGVLLFAFLLVWLGTVIVFVGLRLASRLRFGTHSFLLLSGLIATAGFPIVEIISGVGRFLALEAAVVAVVAAVISLGFVKPSAASATCVTVIHFGLWGWAAKESWLPVKVFLWPNWSWVWRTEEYSWLWLLFSSLSLTIAWFLMTKRIAEKSSNARAV